MRKNPPRIGSRITYKYYGLTDDGKPRHPVFDRVREDIWLTKIIYIYIK